jgi:hypothetical protein
LSCRSSLLARQFSSGVFVPWPFLTCTSCGEFARCGRKTPFDIPSGWVGERDGRCRRANPVLEPAGCRLGTSCSCLPVLGASWALAKQAILPDLGVEIEGENRGMCQLFQLVTTPWGCVAWARLVGPFSACVGASCAPALGPVLSATAAWA